VSRYKLSASEMDYVRRSARISGTDGTGKETMRTKNGM
jgi:hypothetical protein